jgi:hypothetical protein
VVELTDATGCLLAVAWRAEPAPAPGGWIAEPVLADQTALDRAGSKGRTPPPFHTLLWAAAPAAGPLTLPTDLAPAVDRWAGFRFSSRPAWDDTATEGAAPHVKQVSFLHTRDDLAPGEFARHYREHVAVARVHHPAICRYAQHDVVETVGDAGLDTQGISELWFADEATLVARYFAGPDSVPIVRADNREYIDFAGTLSLLVRPSNAR